MNKILTYLLQVAVMIIFIGSMLSFVYSLSLLGE